MVGVVWIVTSKSCSLAMGCFVCFASSEWQIIILAGCLVLGESAINPVGSIIRGRHIPLLS